MLEVVRVTSPADKRARFDAFDPRGRTWVVSDLQSKWHLQKELLAREGRLEQSCVVRATELWTHLAFQLEPDVRLLSAELAQTLFWNWIEPMDLPWARSPFAVPVVVNQMQMWMTILSDPRAGDVMGEWFEANPESFVRWGHWFKLCLEIWRRCRDEGVLMTSWLPALLLGQDLAELRFDRALTFDLGAQVSQVEGLLIKELGRHFDVTLFYPEAPWIGLMPNTLRPYDEVLDKPFVGDPGWQPPAREALGFGRFSTQLAEVKDAVATARAWLDAGVPAQRIALVAPDVEEYWPALRLYLDQEGIPACKPVTARLGAFPEMAHWAASLRTALNAIAADDLEVYLFGGSDRPPLAFDEFRVLFSNVYDAFDLARARHLFESLDAPDVDRPGPVTDFLAWALRAWVPTHDAARLIELLKAVGQEVPPRLMLSPRQWLVYVEGLLARREVPVRGADETGVWCVSLSSADWLPATHGIFLNLAEGSLRSFRHAPVSAAEGQKVFADTGWAVGTNDRQELEFELLWFMNRGWEELRLTFAESDFEGRVLTPSRLWMWAAFANGSLKTTPDAPGVTRWDEIQRGSFDALIASRGIDAVHARGLREGLARDVSTEISSWAPSPRVRISASSLRDYAACPFVYAAGRELNLSDEPALDLDLDPMKRGSLLHAIAEALAEEPFRGAWTDDELAALVDRVRAEGAVAIGDERMWPIVRAQHVRLARQFLEFESSWRARFPSTRTVGREVAFRCGWDVANAEPTPEPGEVTLAGRIDRIDRDGAGRAALIDYKASDAGLTNWASWAGKDDLQMPLYAALIEAGLAGPSAMPVVAANYYVIKRGDRRKGFHLRDDGAELYDPAFKHQNFLTDDQKTALYGDVFARVTEMVTRLRAGDSNPRPRDESLCTDCSWRTLCRAPHLN